MSKYSKVALFVGLTLLPVSVVIIYGIASREEYRQDSGQQQPGGYQVVYWQKLRELDYEKGSISDDLKNLNGKKVSVPGFVVPLDDEAAGSAEFLLVPSPKACIHVPPPPPNQMIMVRMKSSSAPKREWGPVWVRGILRIEESESGFGKVSFLLLGEETEKYKAPETTP